MKRTIATIILIAALAAGIVGIASSASAFPTKRTACSRCHGSSTAVKITLTRTSSTATRVTYKIKVTGGSGAAGWALLRGTTNVKHRTASTGVFTVTKGKTYKVWAVKKGTGARSRTLTAK